jgi:D-tyrosyl-tRNA(Tyr) deacylase
VRAVVQRVREARVTVGDECVGAIGLGLAVLVGVTHADAPADAERLGRKVAALRVFDDEHGQMNRGLDDVGGAMLVVSQFTLYGDCRKGRRPAFVDAARPAQARALYERFVDVVRDAGVPVQTGRFQAHMQVALVNDGPVTLLLDSGTLGSA